MPTIYGIKNCDTMKKALKWLDSVSANIDFHDYKKQSLDEAAFTLAVKQHGWENVLNRRGTTWRKLDEDVKNNMDDAKALDIARENPSIVKRPLLIVDGQATLGFSEDTYSQIFKKAA